MSAPDRVGLEWTPWIEKVSEALGVDPGLVDVGFIHSLTQSVARGFERPMGPVAAYILGLGLAAHPDRNWDEVRAVIMGALLMRQNSGMDDGRRT